MTYARTNPPQDHDFDPVRRASYSVEEGFYAIAQGSTIFLQMRNAQLLSMFFFLAILPLELLQRVFLQQIAMQANAHRNLKDRLCSAFVVSPY
jgi:hypothetical protein